MCINANPVFRGNLNWAKQAVGLAVGGLAVFGGEDDIPTMILIYPSEYLISF